MLLPVQVESRLARLPRATVGLVALNLVIYGILVMQAFGQNHSLIQDIEFLPPNLVQQWGLLPDHVSASAFLTAPWIHLDILHLAGNLLFLWVFGAAAEESLGWTAVAAVYLLGGLCASLSQYAASWAGIAPSDIVYAGSSGSVIAVIVSFALRRYRAAVRIWLLGIELAAPAWSVLLAFAVWYGVAPVITGERGGASGYWGHLGGALAGLFLSLTLRLAPQGGIDYELDDAIGRINRGDLKHGLDRLISLRRLAPADPRVPLALARSYAKVWDSKTAGKHFGEAVQLELAQGRTRGAMEVWEEASQAGALVHPRLALNLASALAAEGNSALAAQLFEWAAAGPDEATARIARQRLSSGP